MNIEKIQTALEFAAQAHKNQKIPGSDLPYFLHVVEVYSELIPLLNQQNDLDFELLFCSAILHDTIEDTSVSFGMIVEKFGEAIAKGVLALSKNPNLPKEKQMADSLERIIKEPKEIRMVKMADRINNLKNPPHYWDLEKRKKYQKEAQLILEKLGGGSSPLIERRLQRKIEEYSQYFQTT